MNQSLKGIIQQMGKSPEKVEEQLGQFRSGFPFLDIKKPATVEDGVIKLSTDSLDHFISFYEERSLKYDVVKFVPASGAASRMFKRLFEFLEEEEKVADTDAFLKKFFEGLSNFAFAGALDKVLQTKGTKLEKARLEKQYHLIVSSLLNEDGLNYGQLPKGLLEFHRYGEVAKTPTAEHFTEGENYAKGKNGVVHLHFTVSPEHQSLFEDHIKDLNRGLSKFEVTFSQQDPATDTIAVTPENEPFVDGNEILFRPAGHGALIENLNQVDADVVFIKNIDNVVPDHLKETTIRYKKGLAGLLISVQHQVFSHLEQLARNINELELLEVEEFARKELMLSLKDDYNELPFVEKVGYLQYLLHRPIRVCGMVPNTGEPGGGPFWIKESDGAYSLQVVETSQFNPDNEEATQALEAATHFNPVDLVCAYKDYAGKKFDLKKYVDYDTGFITEKSKGGKSLKALELPGLWNGSMSNWITLFVEVPIETFNPVKTVNDLLREQHQGV
jgi:hypothetical protein